MTFPRLRRRVLRPTLERLDERSLLSGLTPAVLTHAYGLDAITFSAGGQVVKGTGSGETIAVVDAFHDPYISADLHTFDQANGLADPSFTQINLAGDRINSGWAQEEALDVEWRTRSRPERTSSLSRRSRTTPGNCSRPSTWRGTSRGSLPSR